MQFVKKHKLSPEASQLTNRVTEVRGTHDNILSYCLHTWRHCSTYSQSISLTCNVLFTTVPFTICLFTLPLRHQLICMFVSGNLKTLCSSSPNIDNLISVDIHSNQKQGKVVGSTLNRPNMYLHSKTKSETPTSLGLHLTNPFLIPWSLLPSV